MAAAEERRALGTGEVCPICLAPMRRPALAERCLHAFCLDCIRQWATIVPACPLCKTPFRAVLHDVYSPTAFSATWLAGDAAPDHIRRLSQPPAHVRRRHVYESGAQPAAVAPTPWPARRLRPKLPKLEAWLARELSALAHGSDASVLVSQLRAVLAAGGLDWEDASLCDRVQAALPAPARAPHFVREAACFLATGFNVPTYDREVAYAWTRPALALAPDQAPESELCRALRKAARRGAEVRGAGGAAGGAAAEDGQEVAEADPAPAAGEPARGDAARCAPAGSCRLVIPAGGSEAAVEAAPTPSPSASPSAAATPLPQPSAQDGQLWEYRDVRRQATARRKRIRELDRDLAEEVGRLRRALR